MINRKRNAIALVVLAALTLATASGCNSQPTPAKATPTAGTSGGRPLVGETIIADGRVRPARSADLTVAAAGTVTELLVAEGDAVKKDQPLLRLDSRRQTAALAQAEAALAGAKAAQAGAQAGTAKAQAALAAQKAGPRTEDVAVARAAVQIAEAELNRVLAGPDPSLVIAAKAAVDKAARAVQQAQFAYDHSSAGASGPESLRLEQATIDYEAAKGQYDQLGLLPRGADVAVARARLVQSQAALALSLAGPRPDAVKAAEADVAAAEASAGVAVATVGSAEAAVAQAKAALADTELRAPFDGIVAMLGVQAGETASAGSVAVRLGDPSVWLVDTTDLTELNIAKLGEGSAATLTLDAVPGLTLTGKVSKIRPYGETRQGDVVYAITVTPDRQDPRLRWNMTVKVSLEPK